MTVWAPRILDLGRRIHVSQGVRTSINRSNGRVNLSVHLRISHIDLRISHIDLRISHIDPENGVIDPENGVIDPENGVIVPENEVPR